MKSVVVIALFVALSQTCCANGRMQDASSYYTILGKSVLKEHIAYMVVINFAVIAPVALYLFLDNKVKARVEQERNLVAAVQNLSNELELMKNRDLEAKQLMTELLEGRFAVVNELCATYYEYQGTPKEQKKIADEVKRYIKSISGDGNNIAALEHYVNKYNENIMGKLRKEFPNIKKSECDMFLYMAAGFSSKAISVFICEKLEVVYNRKSRLRSKIKSSNSVYKDAFLQLMS